MEVILEFLEMLKKLPQEKILQIRKEALAKLERDGMNTPELKEFWMLLTEAALMKNKAA